MRQVSWIGALCLLVAINLQAAPAKDAWNYWNVNNPKSTTKIDHGTWQRFLQRHVKPQKNGLNLIDYENVEDYERSRLHNYILQLAQTDIRQYNRKEQLAFWINLYNALTVSTVLRYYPVETIQDISISGGRFVQGPWRANLLKIGTINLSLDDIEHRILRPLWEDPRIHYALCKAARGAPNIQNQAFTAENTERLLEKATKEFVASPRAMTIKDDKVTVSKIYQWSKSDFGGNDKAILDYLQKYAKADDQKVLATKEKVDAYEFDWTLNGTEIE